MRKLYGSKRILLLVVLRNVVVLEKFLPFPRQDSKFAGNRVNINVLDVNCVVRRADFQRFVRVTKVNRLAKAIHKAENALLFLESSSAVSTGGRSGTYAICWGWE